MEDNTYNLLLAQKMLEKLGHEVDGVENGEDAFRALGENRYDLVFMDIQLPSMSGVEVTEKIRQKEGNVLNSEIPVIAMTAHALEGDKEFFLAAGMDDYIAKPINRRELAAVISRTVSKRKNICAV